MNAARLRQLRQARGLSLDQLAAQMGGIVTKQALSKYEQGKAQPSPKVLVQLANALGVKAARLWSEPTIQVQFFAYRRASRLLRKEQSRLEGLVTETLEQRVRLQDLVAEQNGRDLPIKARKIDTLEEAESAAETLRGRWALGSDAIASLVNVLEEHHVHVIEVKSNDKFDGLSAVAYDEERKLAAAAIVTRSEGSGERQRFNLAHELGHLFLDVSVDVDEEKAAHRFAGAFLAPRVSLFREVGRQRTFIQPQELLIWKRQFGVSMQALLYRLRDLEIITESYYRQWCIHISRQGWKKKEPMELPREEPQWLRSTVLRAFAEGLLEREEADRLIGEAPEGKPALSLVQRRAFLRLPLEKRRQLLAEQAERAASQYEENRESQSDEVEDILEY